MLDNFDSFTHNAVDQLAQLGAQVAVERNDAVSVAEVAGRAYDGIVLSPGPGRPETAGVLVPLIEELAAQIPILGICLGLQAMAIAFGGRVVRARRPLHGQATLLRHEGAGLLAGMPSPFRAARYHSLVVDPDAPGAGLLPTCWSEEGEIMAMRHETFPLEGMQFHPESYLSPEGPRVFEAFLRRTGALPRAAERVRT